jgi:shikimate kinase
MTKTKRIFIVGHTGAGKSLCAEALAKKLGWQFIDANPGLERYIGRSLTEIF